MFRHHHGRKNAISSFQGKMCLTASFEGKNRTMPGSVLDNGNLKVFESRRVKKHYRRVAGSGLYPQEEALLDSIPANVRDSVLDIGIGAGRTTGPLAGIFRKYVGVDYAAPLVASAAEIFPNCDLRVMDARELPFEEEFDCVLFSYNGIDLMPWEDRMRAFEGMARALKPGGFLIYSAHNAAYRRRAAWMHSFWVSELLKSHGSPRWFLNRLRRFNRQFADPDGRYFIVNTSALSFSVLNVMADLPREFQAIRKFGLTVQAQIGSNKPGGSGFDDNDPWVYVLAQKQ
jgi:SAM-dependent methyltransferase